MSKNTTNLPFIPVDSSKKLSAVEEDILKFWNENDIFHKSMENRKTTNTFSGNTNDNSYSFYDGPPFATGLPHYGHIVASVIKDVIPRYWTMKGKYIPRKWGWDCHGLPIENIVEKELGSKTKKEIEELGVEKFNNLCRSKVLEYADEWKKIMNRLGRWADMDDAYRTMDKDFMESVWWTFKQLWDKDLIYYSYRSMHICPRCETTLSQSEVSEGYKDIKDLSVIAKFQLKTGQKILVNSGHTLPWDDNYHEIGDNTYILAWTTTPWTLPGNVALAIDPSQSYVLHKHDDGNYYIIVYNKFKDFFNLAEKENVFLVSGKHAFASRKYFPKLKKDLEKEGYKVTIIDHINSSSPNLKENLKNLKKYNFNNAHIITHSLGASTILKYLNDTTVSLSSLIMIAPTTPGVKFTSTDPQWAKKSGYFDFEVNYTKVCSQINNTPIIIYSTEKTISEQNFKQLGENLNASLIPELNKGHYFESDADNPPNFDIVGDIYDNSTVRDAFNTIKGSALLDLEYKPLWDTYSSNEKLENRKNGWKIVEGVYDKVCFVNTQDGTGVVHIAPAFGEDDMALGKEKDLPFVQHVGMDGVVDKKVEAIGGLNVKPIENPQSTDIEVIKYLAGQGTLFHKEKYEHSYPHCWRCDTPLINYATGSWFVAVTKIKETLLENAKEINWTPEHLKEGRFGKWLEGGRDWSISRQRFWASVMPIWVCNKCEEKKVFGSAENLEEKMGSFFIMRHGEAESNISNIFSCQPNDGFSLTKKGKKDVRKNALELKKQNFDLIISSDIDRAKQTAEIISEITDVKVVFDKNLREVNMGDFHGKNMKNMKDFKDKWNNIADVTFPNGDSWLSLKKRMHLFYDNLFSKYYNKNVLIISHGDPIISLEALLLNSDYLSKLKDLHKNNYPQKAVLRKVKYSLLDLHKHVVDKISFKCEKCGGTMHRVPDVLDTWFDSGSMPYGQAHYPFENKEVFENNFPADFIAEGIDQTRAWFYYLHVIAGGIFEKEAFKNVITNGMVLAEDGQKMAKKLQNYPDPMEMVDTYGADSLKFYLAQSPVVNANDFRFSEKDLAEVARGTFRMLWQSYSFFVMYANVDGWTPLCQGYAGQAPNITNLLDKWLISELHQLIKSVNKEMDNYHLMQATRLFAPFIDNLSNWYIRRSRKRFWKSENDADKNEAYATLHYVLVELSKTIAPFAPFLADEIYKNLTGEESVHLANFPVADDALINSTINKDMTSVREIIKVGLQLRAKNQIKVRQPLSELIIKNEEFRSLASELLEIIEEELNVKDVSIGNASTGGDFVWDNNKEVGLTIEITPELKAEGQAREIIRAIQQMRKEADYQLDDRIRIGYNGLATVFEQFRELIAKETLADEVLSKNISGNDLEKNIEIDSEKVVIQVKKQL